MNIDELIRSFDPLRDEDIPGVHSLRASAILERSTSRTDPRDRGVPRRRSGPRRVPITLIGVAASIAVVVFAAVPVLTPSSPVKNDVVNVPNPVKGQWSLAGYITESGWQANSSTGPLPTSLQFATQLVCPTARTCLAAGNDNRARFRNSQGVIAVTHDGGLTWKRSLAPYNGTVFQSVSCVSATSCMAISNGVKFHTPPVLYTTSDGGESWQSSVVHGAKYGMFDLSCSNARRCVVFAMSPTPTAPYSVIEGFVTSDGGRSWRSVKLPPDFAPSGSAQSALQCFANGHCTASGIRASRIGFPGHADMIYSNDAGATWSTSSAPPVKTNGLLMTCSSANHCLTVVANEDPNGLSTTRGVMTSSDGGATWVSTHSTGLHTSINGHPFIVDAVTCAAVDQCWVSGHLITSMCQGTCPYAPNQAVMFSSTSFGRAWKRVPLPTPPSATLEYESVWPLGCASATHCFSVGWLATTKASAARGTATVQQDVVLSWIPKSSAHPESTTNGATSPV